MCSFYSPASQSVVDKAVEDAMDVVSLSSERSDVVSSTSGGVRKHPVLVARRNARERNRVRQVNMGFVTLRDHIPHQGKSKKLSKVETLRAAAGYIRYLEQLLSASDSVQLQMSNYMNLNESTSLPLTADQPFYQEQNGQCLTVGNHFGPHQQHQIGMTSDSSGYPCGIKSEFDSGGLSGVPTGHDVYQLSVQQQQMSILQSYCFKKEMSSCRAGGGRLETCSDGSTATPHGGFVSEVDFQAVGSTANMTQYSNVLPTY